MRYNTSRIIKHKAHPVFFFGGISVQNKILDAVLLTFQLGPYCPGIMPGLGYLGTAYGPTQRPAASRMKQALTRLWTTDYFLTTDAEKNLQMHGLKTLTVHC